MEVCVIYVTVRTSIVDCRLVDNPQAILIYSTSRKHIGKYFCVLDVGREARVRDIC